MDTSNDFSFEDVQNIVLSRNKIAQWHRTLRKQFFKLVPGFYVRCRQEDTRDIKPKYKLARIRAVRPDWSIEVDVLTKDDEAVYLQSSRDGAQSPRPFVLTNYDCVSNSPATHEEYTALVNNLIDVRECAVLALLAAERLKFISEVLLMNVPDKGIPKMLSASQESTPGSPIPKRKQFSTTVHLIREGEETPRDVDIFSLLSPQNGLTSHGSTFMPEADTPSTRQRMHGASASAYASMPQQPSDVISDSTITALSKNTLDGRHDEGMSKIALELLEIIHRYPQGLCDAPSKHSLHLRYLIDNVMEATHALLATEPLFLRVKSPVYVLGDIHGNLADLNHFLSQILPFNDWQMRLTTVSILFLGDYVDRGAHSIECMLLLFCLKILAPAKVFLLRGNHESPEVNGDHMLYGPSTYRAQCIALFGTTYGLSLWNQSNEVFAHLGICATIDNTVFCVHGGIPQYTGGEDRRLQILMDDEFPRLFRVQDEEAMNGVQQQMLNDMLWSDPAEDDTPLNEYGFGPNARGPDVVSFGSYAISEFCNHFGFQYIFRAHQEKAHGLRLSDSARVVTIFSTSDYSGHQNGAGCIFVSESTIRLIIKTSSPSFDT
ncbi:serine/threonine protein phosphatase [Perkinsela sp. CCAP 1560/4]|nr:serine/threonine protein phosphatase [Perkinsela sp. CCAP 1560/4]|eukprot:KNH07508.1 serine/threonine protein phosphatase [Perkinsela sp. CCAP 1560/4]